LNRDKDIGEEDENQIKVDEFYDMGLYNGEVDYLEVDPDGMMSSEHQTLLMPPGMRPKQYY